MLKHLSTCAKRHELIADVGHKTGSRETLASGSSDKTILLWDVDLESWQRRACRIVNRNLTRAEWAQYFNRDPVTYDTVYAKNLTCPDLPLEPVATATPTPHP